MRKIRKLLAVPFCAALVILGIQLKAEAQQSPQRPEQTGESPRDLGRNAGTGDPVLRTGAWELDGIRTTAIYPDGRPRDTLELPLDTRQRSGIAWGINDTLIKVAVVFMDLKKTVTGTNAAGPLDASLKVLVKTEVMTTRDVRGKNDYLLMRCNIDFKSASGELRGGLDRGGFRDFRIYPASYPDYKKDEFTCGGDLRPGYIGGKDFTLNVELKFYTPTPVDVTYHFYYRFGGWKSTALSPGDTGVAPSDREGQYRWAQKQDAATLESRLISNATLLFNSPSVSTEKLSSAFADVSVIIADRASNADFSAADKDAASSNWSTHKNWAARQGPKTSLDNLQHRLRAAFNYLSRSQKDLFFADVSVAMAKAEAGGAGNDIAAQRGPGPTDSNTSQDRPLVQPTKSVFGINEAITIDYYNPKGSGWDWVVVVNPNSTAEGKGPFSSIDDRYGKRFDPNDNSLKERNGTFSFDRLPEGEYEVRYVAWYLDGMAGANKILGPARFRVGNQISASPPPGPGPGSNPPPSANPAKDLTGLWRNPGGNAVYRVRQIGTKLVWGLDAVAIGSWANVFQGQILGNTIDGVWEDLPGSPTIGGGRMLLRIESECRFVRVSSVNPYGADVWVRKDSTCDATGVAQRSNPSGTRPANKATKPAPTSPAKTKPNTEVIADNRARANPPTVPTNKPNKPLVVEEIPEDTSTKVAANTPAPKPRNKPLVVEEIPESASPNVASNRPPPNQPVVEEIPEMPPATNTGANRHPGNSSSGSGSGAEKLPPNVKRDKNGKLQPKDGYVWENPDDPQDLRVKKKPRDPNKPDIWTLLGGAVREAITASPTPGQTQPSVQAPSQTSGCQVGPYSLFALNQPRANEQVWMRFTAPAGRGTGSGDWVGIFRAGETQSTNDRLVSWMYLNSPDCVERFNLPAGQFDAYVFDASSFRATGNRSPISGGVRLIVNP